MTPRDELRRAREIVEQIRERVRDAGEGDPLALRDDVDSLALYAIDEIAATAESLPSLPVGGGDGARAEFKRVIAWLEGQGIILRDRIVTEDAYAEDFATAAADAVSVSSSAGDEAREALEHADVALSCLDATPLDDVAVRAAHLDEARRAVTAALASLSSPPPGAGDGLTVQGLLNAVNNVLVWIASNDLPMDGDDQQEVWAMLDRWEQLTGLEHDERARLLDGRYEEGADDGA